MYCLVFVFIFHLLIGKRIIILHCGGEAGFVEDVGRIYIAGQRNPEYRKSFLFF